MRNNHDTYWFPAKRYGWGWGLPCRWQGWVVLALYAALLAAGSIFIWQPDDTASFLVYFSVLTIALVLICWWKGEKPAWRWGNK